MGIETVALLNGSVGMVVGALMVARRDACGRVVRELCGIPPRWSAVVAGVVTGSGLSVLIAATLAIQAIVAHWV